MGADLILSAYRLPAGRKPDFEQCREAVRRWGPEKLEEMAATLSGVTGLDFTADKVQSAAEAAIVEVEGAYQGHRYSTVLVFGGDVAGERIEVLVAGGTSWGDDPYEEFETFSLFGELGLDREW